MLQLVLSVIISSMAFAYHVYALPYIDRWLNLLQGACLFMIWASLQAGMLMVTTQPNLSAGSNSKFLRVYVYAYVTRAL